MFGRLKEQPPPQSLVGGATTAPAEQQPGEEGHGPREGLILLLFTILTLAATAYVLAKAERDAVHDPVQKASRGEVDGLATDSFIREENFRRALAKIASNQRPFVTNIRVAPERVNATVRDQDGSRTFLNIDLNLKVTETDANVGDDPALRAAQFNAAAPSRMLRAVAERTGLGEDAIDYVTMSVDDEGPQTWYMALDKGGPGARAWIAEADGSDVRKPGEPSLAQKRADAREKARLEREQRRLNRVLTQRSKCLSKARTAEAASRCIERFQP